MKSTSEAQAKERRFRKKKKFILQRHKGHNTHTHTNDAPVYKHETHPWEEVS